MANIVTNAARRACINRGERYGIEYKAPGARRWVELGTAGSYAQASVWTTRFYGSGTYRIRKPVTGAQ